VTKIKDPKNPANAWNYETLNLLTVADVAEAFEVTSMTIYLWRRYRGLPFLLIPSQGKDSVRFYKDKVVKWARRQGLDVPESLR
jgi:hypothetical protein